MSTGDWLPVNDTTGRTTISFIPGYGVLPCWVPADNQPPYTYIWPPITVSPSYTELMARVTALEWELEQLKKQIGEQP